MKQTPLLLTLEIHGSGWSALGPGHFTLNVKCP